MKTKWIIISIFKSNVGLILENERKCAHTDLKAYNCADERDKCVDQNKTKLFIL